METPETTGASIARLGALIADETRAEILCALMDGRAHTGSEFARHIGVAPSTVSEHLSKLLDADIVAVEPEGRHRYWRLADPKLAEFLEAVGATATRLAEPRAPSDLLYLRTCYDHLAGELGVAIYDQLLKDACVAFDDGQLRVTPSGFELLERIGADRNAIEAAKRPQARPCLDWTQRRHHLAGAAAKELLSALTNNGWIQPGPRPRSMRLTEIGRQSLGPALGVTTFRPAPNSV